MGIVLTQAYFFTEEELRTLVTGCGFVEQSIEFEERDMQNKKEGKTWKRRWLQGIFYKP